MPLGRLRRPALAAVFLCMPLTACVDGSAVSGPDLTFDVPLALAPVFMESVTDVPPGPITHVRLEAVDLETRQIVGASTHAVNPDASQWLLELTVEIPAYSELDVDVLVVLLSGDQSAGLPEWSGRSGRIALSASTPDRSIQQLPVYRGPPANLDVTALDASVTGELVDGDRVALDYQIQGGGAGTRVFLRSLDPSIVDFDGDMVVGTGVGTGRVIAEAGPVADTVTVTVAPWPLPDPERIDESAPSLDDSGTRLLGNLGDAAGAAEISSGMQALSTALASGSGGDIVRAIDSVRTSIASYNGGNWGPDGPDLSLVLHSLDVLELTLQNARGNTR